ncbi:MAG: hypothetical protein LH468_09940 [Nocardioides sp.]|nr:hypothetical protein [Nocardioides sp.]
MPPTLLMRRHSLTRSGTRRTAAVSPPGAELTGGVLRALRRRRKVLGWVPQMPNGAEASFDLVLTAAGPLAIDSVRGEGELEPAYVVLVAARARDAARQAQSVFGVAGFFDPVLPVVVVWGGDAYAVPAGGCLLHDVLFLRGRELKHWLRRELARGDRVDEPVAQDLLVRLSLIPA